MCRFCYSCKDKKDNKTFLYFHMHACAWIDFPDAYKLPHKFYKRSVFRHRTLKNNKMYFLSIALYARCKMKQQFLRMSILAQNVYIYRKLLCNGVTDP